ncbi:SpaA isopeptide-forming pilin-related protein [uncultured Gemmiger sp.]|uniref:SpaA isopeptide-forming pilin-related protein n=1 Tax=uncultured Gemmiger sp. TaxID=1623490 RepID=UPI0025E278CF|nr:SpaA isopeptide-forming pilin-related protein [uncultured Gemmiger sp.]
MYKHSTTHRTLSRRLAALLAVLALLAALALPVYAEALDGAAGTAQAEIGDTISDGTVTTENDSTTPEGKEAAKDSTANADGNNASENKDTNDDTSQNTTGDSNTTAGNAANDTPQTPPADNIDTTAGNTTTNDTLDTMDEDEDAKQDIVTRSADGAETADDAATDNEIAASSVTYPVWVYVAVKDDFQEGWTVKFNSNKAKPKEAENWLEKQRMVEKTPYKGRKVFGFELTQDNCPNNGYSRIQFLPWNSNDQQQNPIYEASNTWKDINEFANKLYDAKTGEWVVDYKPFDPTDHTAFSGKKMAFKNASTDALTNVVAHFYEKDANGNLNEVEIKQLPNGVPAGAKEEFEIPTGKPCGFVQFTAGEPEKIISSIYNFYGQKVGTGEESFLYNEETQFCFVYSANNMAHWGTGEGQRTIYYDATFSKLSADTGYAIPSNVGGTVYYYLTGEGKEGIAGEMARQTNDLYSVDIEDDYDHIIFGAYKPTSATNVAGRGNSTANLEIPDEYTSPCFYADTGDDSTYGGANWNTDLTRGGYWAEVNTLRDAEKGKGKTNDPVVNIQPATFNPDPATKYINTTLYDYYTDWELNGNNRGKYDVSNGASQRNWVTFRQFDQALSDYYIAYNSTNKEGKSVAYPIYTGHFQPDYLGGDKFSNIADKLNLYGWSRSESDYNTFISVNNSATNIKGTHNLGSNDDKDIENYNWTFQGLVSKNLSADGTLTMYGTDLSEPHFSKDFLEGDNSKKAVLGKVYENVSFPFTKENVFNNGVDYWYYDAGKKSLYLKQGTDNKYFLQAPDGGGTDDRSKNVNSSSGELGTYGFFPFNEKSSVTHANTYNYGFGAKLQFDFTLTDDGQVLDNNGKKVPIQFFFSGDDDVWVYIDNELALDVGGAHGKASGLLEFGPKKDGKNTYTAYVSKVKAGNKDQSYTSGANKSVTYLGSPISFKYQSEEKTLTPGKHTLRLFYMERGMWESNMAIAFNFPDNNELQVEKKVDLSNVKDPEFAACFTNQKIFNFTIQNQATHYGEKAAVGPDESGTQSQKVDLTKGVDIAPATPNREYEYIFKLDKNPKQPDPGHEGEKVLHWYARYTDTEPVSEKRNKRYGILTLENPINIEKMRFLTFQVYVDSNDGGGGALSLNNLYLELLDDQNPRVQKGSLGTTGINGATYGSVEVKTDKWVTVKLDLNKMKAQEGFSGNVKTIRVGDNYSRNIYFRNFTFIPKAVPSTMTGFTTDQKEIPDYGSAKSGQLENAENAQYTSTKDKDTQLVDDAGRFVLEDGETVTFSDQFRRGSYISLREKLNPSLYDTTWTVYENGQVVTSTNPDDISNVNTVKFGEKKSLEKQNDPPKGPDDGRTEVYVDEDGVKNDGYKANKKPDDTNTIVFRSYMDPDETSSKLTKLKVKYVNTVKTGGLKIQKKAAAGEVDNIKGTYKFKVTFNDVGGEGLEEKPIIRYVEINMSDEKKYPDHTVTITGIPVGTRYTIEEETPKDDSRLQSVTVPDSCKSAHVIKNNTMVEGVIVKSKDPNDPELTAIFTNTQRTLINIEFDKHWKDANDEDIGTANQPDEIYIQLQRRLKDGSNWTSVNYPADSKKDYVIIERGENVWQHTFSGLDQYQINTDNSHTDYVYRIVEGTVDDKGSFNPAAEDGTITIKGKTYVVTAEATAKSETNSETGAITMPATATDGTITGGSGKIVLTNKLQNPKFNLDILKKSADEPETPLKGVEFKLEKLTADGKAVDTSFPARIGITNAQGEVKEKGSNGNATGKDIFHDLEAGAYRLTETKTAEGYNLLSAPILVTFDKDRTCKLNGSTIVVSTKENKPTEFTKDGNDRYTLALTVLNRKTPALPHTGADAPSLWLLIGLPLAVAGLLILVFRYNKKGGRTR